jgi:hypothetical protein
LRLQTCITWTKKRSKGWVTFKNACAHFSRKVMTFITPVKTRLFTSVSSGLASLLATLTCKCFDSNFPLLLQTWKMLRNLIGFKEVVNYMYGTMRETSHLRDRYPQPSIWAIAEMLVGDLDCPCNVVIKTHDQGHWYLSDDITSVFYCTNICRRSYPNSCKTRNRLKKKMTQSKRRPVNLFIDISLTLPYVVFRKTHVPFNGQFATT